MYIKKHYPNYERDSSNENDLKIMHDYEDAINVCIYGIGNTAKTIIKDLKTAGQASNNLNLHYTTSIPLDINNMPKLNTEDGRYYIEQIINKSIMGMLKDIDVLFVINSYETIEQEIISDITKRIAISLGITTIVIGASGDVSTTIKQASLNCEFITYFFPYIEILEKIAINFQRYNYSTKLKPENMYQLVLSYITNLIKSLIEPATVPGLVGVGFGDIRTALDSGYYGVLHSGKGHGDNHSNDALLNLVTNFSYDKKALSSTNSIITSINQDIDYINHKECDNIIDKSLEFISLSNKRPLHYKPIIYNYLLEEDYEDTTLIKFIAIHNKHEIMEEKLDFIRQHFSSFSLYK